MCDIDKILEKFESDLKAKSPEEKVAYLQSYGFQVHEKKSENIVNSKKQNKGLIKNNLN